jgi:hypothetical protein
LRISSVNLDLAKAPLDHLALVASKLSRLAQLLRPYLQKRHQQERIDGRPGVANSAFDLDYLRGLGLDDYAADLDEFQREQEAADGEEDPSRAQTEERPARDVGTDIRPHEEEEVTAEGTPPAAGEKEGDA